MDNKTKEKYKQVILPKYHQDNASYEKGVVRLNRASRIGELTAMCIMGYSIGSIIMGVVVGGFLIYLTWDLWILLFKFIGWFIIFIFKLFCLIYWGLTHWNT